MGAGVYFGTIGPLGIGHQAYERAPKPGMDASMVGFAETGQLENGGAYAVQSNAAHQELKPEWGGSNTELQRWRAYQQGKWGTGPFYWVDPYATNLLVPQWGTPYLTTLGDWRPLYPLASGQGTATLNTQTYSGLVSSTSLESSTTLVSLDTITTYGATYTVSGAPVASKYKHVILVPPDRNLYFGASGTAGMGGNVTLEAVYRDGSVTTTVCTLLSPTGLARTNMVISGADVAYVRIYLAGTGTVTVNDMCATLQGPVTGPAVDGQGTWALRWGGAPSRAYTYAGHTGRAEDTRQEMSATLIETYL